MKKIFSISLLAFFIMHFAGFYVYFIIRQVQIHREMRCELRTMPADQLELMHLSGNAYRQALTEEDEMEIDGKMYDIARVEPDRDSVLVYALHDAAEDSLLSFIDKVLKNAAQDAQQVPSPLFQFASLAFIIPSVFTLESTRTITNGAFTRYFAGESSIVLSLDTPPPRA